MAADRIANLGMYDAPWLRAANDALWAAVAPRLRAAGLAGVPDALERRRPPSALWRDPSLLLAQTCGYPLASLLGDAVTVVARPIHELPGCAGGTHRSFVVVRADAPFRTLADLAGRRAALNGRDSNTGMNLLRHAVAPLSRGGRFFGAVVETGGHLASLSAVRNGSADVAAIDCVVFGLAARHSPGTVAGLRILADTATSPALPFVTAGGAGPGEVAALRDALAGAIADPALAGAAGILGLAGVEPATAGDYAPLLGYEADAVRAGYPTLS